MQKGGLKFLSCDAFHKHIIVETAKWARVVKAASIRVE
jgi:hypothetical protein